MGDEGCLPLVSISDADIVISPLDIEFGEDLGILHLINEILDQREGVGIFDSVGVDISVVLAWSEGVGSVLLIDEEEGCCLGGVRGTYPSKPKVFF